ncbi:hypothetical protein M422DRAFT_262371 [Sphaerobolus stellatus SS14]|uniref:Squalene monooxygenase n=1 Tax=Sphaerobolus stellatus (strain SS14) TaxID=990650 RepID=A0A0C9UKQ5_SPHS4|nr:hypothetical protein M422DRAFT_262371 [Sphaerobolus stellatus SS14]
MEGIDDLCLLQGLSKVMHRKLVQSLSIAYDLPNLGIQRERLSGTAVVCGGSTLTSISGLLIARICSDHFENVTIIEPEEWLLTEERLNPNPDQIFIMKTISNPRARIPQWPAAQGFDASLTLVLEKLFGPEEVKNEVTEAGTKPGWELGTLYFSEEASHSRPSFRRLVLKTKNIQQLSGKGDGLVAQNGALTGVKRRTANGKEEIVPATLVVDFTGVALGGFRWLQELLGSTSAAAKQLASLKETFNNKYQAVSCFFKLSDAVIDEMDQAGIPGIKDNGLQHIFLPNLNADTRSLVLSSSEKNILSISCCEYDMQEEIERMDNIREYYHNLVMEVPLPKYIYTILDILEKHRVPFSKYAIRTPYPVYIQYAKAKGLPSNFIAIGDSVMQLNPIKGQGASKACAEVVSLNKLLLDVKGNTLPSDFGQNFFKLQATRTGGLWSVCPTTLAHEAVLKI